MNLLELPNSPLNATCQQWISLIGEAKKVKHELFGQYAEECNKFFNSDPGVMWDAATGTKQGGYLSEESFGASGLPSFRVCLNKPFEAQALFGPALYHRNPNIVVQPKLPPRMEPEDLGLDPQDPEQQQVAEAVMGQQEMDRRKDQTTGKLCQHYLNWLQLETDKKVQCRRAINDALIRGLGILWTEIYQPPNSQIRYPRSVYVREQDIVKDPDAKYAEDVQWIARRCVHPVNLVEEKYGYAPGELRGTMQSIHSQQTRAGKNDRANGRVDSKSFDLIEYWEIYSKNGAGQHLKRGARDKVTPGFDLEVFGKHCYLVVCNDLPFPLNIPPSLVEAHENEPTEETAQALNQAAQWPIPFWEDEGCNNGWPCSELYFYESTDHIWPIPLTKPAMGEIRFVNWAMSFLADKTAASCKTYIGIQKQAIEDIKQQNKAQLGPFSVIEISQMVGKSIDEVISIIKGPDFDKGLWEMVVQVMELIDKRTGLTELVYGMSGRQMRSAEEARVKNENTTIRPDEMASKTEDFLSNCAMKEMEAAVWALEPPDFMPVFGETASRVFVDHIFTGEDFYERLVRNFTFRVEAGSARKPNKANKVDQLTQLSNFLLPVAMQFAMGGQTKTFNALMYDMADAMDLPEPERYLLDAPPQQPGVDPQAEQAAQQAEMEMKQQEKQADLQLKQQSQEMDLAAKQQQMQLDAEKFQLEAAFKTAEMQQGLQLKQAEFAQDSQIKEQQAAQQSQMAKQQMQVSAIQAAQKVSMDSEMTKSKIQNARAAAKAKPKSK